MKKRLITFLFLFLFLTCPVFGQVFKSGDNVCFLGDSITHGGVFHYDIYEYYLTRFPKATIEFFSAGVSGDSAGGAMTRLEEDVFSKNPNQVVIMLGMNDIGRGNFVENPTPEQLEWQQRSFNSYKANMTKLTGMLQERLNANYFFLTPSPFDQTVVNDRNNNQPGCNDGLGWCAGFVKELCKDNGGLLVDFHGPMTEFNLAMQKSDPQYTIIGPDRVHPSEPGHLVMAWLFLKAQGAPALVSKMEIDVERKITCHNNSAAVSQLEIKPGKITMTILETALPFPTDPTADYLLKILPITNDLNQEIFCVKNLAVGTYELSIDGTAVGQYSSDELQQGINLAVNSKTPQYQQAQNFRKISQQRRDLERILRGYAAVRWFLRNRRVNPDDFQAVRLFAETKMNKTGYFESKVPNYLENWEKRKDIIDAMAAKDAEARKAAIPVPHTFVLELK